MGQTGDPKAPLDGRVAFVTGGGKNLGRRIALDAASRGAAVAVNALQDSAAVAEVVDEIKAAGGRAVSAMGDVTDEAAVTEAMRTARSELGPVTVVVHCAAFRGPHLPIAELPPDIWMRVVSVALDGAFLCAREAIPDMTAEGFGRLVFIGGVSAQLGLPLGSTHGATSKAGLTALVRALAQEHGASGITSNVISPGMLAADQARAMTGGPPSPAVGTSAIERLVSVEEISALCMYLCGAEAAVINGMTILADGGMVSRQENPEPPRVRQ